MGKIYGTKEKDHKKGMFKLEKKPSELEKNQIVKHFRDEGIPRPTIYSILQRMDKNKAPERKARLTPPQCKNDKTTMIKPNVKRLKIELITKTALVIVAFLSCSA